jgi:hypothetical protein
MTIRGNVELHIPGGFVEILQLPDGSYWVHICLDTPRYNDRTPGEIIDWRIDCEGKPCSKMVPSDITRADVHHVALRIRRKES